MKDLSQIEREIEHLGSSTKEFLHSREESILDNLNNNIDAIEKDTEEILLRRKGELREDQKMLLLDIRHMTPKLRDTFGEFEPIINRKPMYKDLDVPLMIDILIRCIKSIVRSIGESKPLDMTVMSSEIELLESLEDQHKRILLTYLMQDWRNLNEVVHLMKVGESYKTMCTQLSDAYSLAKRSVKNS